MIEVEMKFAIGDGAKLARALDTLGIRWLGCVRQQDHYFNHPCRDFAQSDEALRLRCQGEQVVLAYKGPKLDPQTKTRVEIEVPLAAGGEPALQQAQALLHALGFRPVAVVSKQRRRGELEYQGQRVQVAWDQVERLGEFLELEIACREEQAPGARELVLKLARELPLGQSIRKSYLELLLEGPKDK